MEDLLTADEAPPFEVVGARSDARGLLVCDHASNRIPVRLGDLGVDAHHLQEHIAWDIGAAQVTRYLAEWLGCPAVLSSYSRLVVDCNRYDHDPSAFPQVSDQVPVPGNRALSAAEKRRRLAAIHEPYHGKIAEMLGDDPGRVLFSIHTMTRRMRGGAERPQQVTVCWERDDRLARPLLHMLRALGNVAVGDNDPYAVVIGEDYTVSEHAVPHGRPHLQLEIRQDLVARDADARAWAERLHPLFAELLEIAR